MKIRCFLQTRFLEIQFNKTLGQVFVSKHTVEPFKHHSTEIMKPWEKIESSVETLKNSAACLCQNTAYALQSAMVQILSVWNQLL